jgi:hypothetical protein
VDPAPIPSPAPPHDFPAPPALPSTAPAPATSLVFACELPCIHCAYDLRTIPLTANCPECGKPAADSLHSLAAAKPEDIRRVRASLLYLLLAGLGFPLLAFLIGLAAVYSEVHDPTGFAFLVGILLLLGGPLTSFFACTQLALPVRRRFLAQAPPQTELRAPEDAGARRAIKTFGLTHMLLSLAGGLCFWITTSAHSFEERLALLTAALACLAVVAWDTRNFFLCRTIIALCARANLAGIRRIFQFLCGAAIALGIAHALVGLTALLFYLNFQWLGSIFTDMQHRSNLFIAVYGLVTLAASIIQFATLIWLGVWPIMLTITYRALARPLALAHIGGGQILAAPTNPDAAFLSPAGP